MKVGIFYSSINNPHKFPHKTGVMDAFASGVTANGDEVVLHKNQEVIPEVDAGFVLGYTLENTFRKRIIDTLKLRKSKIIFVDSNIFSYGRSSHEWHRYSVDSVYPVDGQYFLDSTFDYSKWNTISSFHKINLKPWRTNGNHILVLSQRTKSWNMLGKSGLEWTLDIVKRLRKITDRSIVVRLHPGDKKNNLNNSQEIKRVYGKGVTISDKENIREDLIDAWCSVGYNSTPNCVSAIEGVPVYLDDPLNSWAADVGFDNLSLLEQPSMPDRNEWIHKISNIHWSNDEIARGIYWSKFKSFYKYF